MNISTANVKKIWDSRRRKAVLRKKILDLFGRKCSNCGFEKDEGVLQLDHIEGQPERFSARSGWQLYELIINGSISDTHFQILCCNCNFLKRLITPSENNRSHIPWRDEEYDSKSEIVESEIIV